MESALIFAACSPSSNQFSCSHFLAILQLCRTTWPQQGGSGRESEPHWEEGKQEALQEEGTEDVKATRGHGERVQGGYCSKGGQ